MGILKLAPSSASGFFFSLVVQPISKWRVNALTAVAITVSTLFLTACGGGGGDGSTTFNIGGSITGLTGEIVLQNNGEAELALSENGTYTFPSQLANASSYSVTVKTQPLDQECSIQNAIGVIDSANSLNIIVVCLDIDTDEDGLTDHDERNIYFTDPRVSDTDGDGLDDFNEIVTKSFNSDRNFAFNPLIADEPKLEIEIISAPVITINYEFEGTESKSTESGIANATTKGRSTNFGSSETLGTEQTHTQGIEVTGEIGIDSSGPSAGGSVTANEEFSQSTSASQTRDFSTEEFESNTKTLSQAIGFETSNTVKSSSGSIVTTVRMKNISNIAYVVEGLTVSAYTRDPRNPYDVSSIGTLTFLEGPNLFPPQTIEPGTQSEVLNFSLTLAVNAANDLKPLLGSPNIVVAPVVGKLTGNDEINFLLASTEILNQTGLVSIDYGPFKSAERYRVATYNREGGEGISFDRLMNGILKIPFTSGEGLWRHGTEATPRASFKGITSVRDTAMSEAKSGYWVVSHTHSIPNSIEKTTDVYNLILADYDLNALVFNTKDVLRFIYIEDEDRDGLALRSELLSGTDPTKKDTDGDQLIDTIEVAGWFSEIDGVKTPFYSNPLKQNSDTDASPDASEYLIGTNPEVADVQLPDTGVGLSQCYQAGSNTLAACASVNLQDGELGRDATLGSNSDLDGKLGFSYTKVCDTGAGPSRVEFGKCPFETFIRSVDCLQDNVTGLVWFTPGLSEATNYSAEHPISSYSTPHNAGASTANDLAVSANNDKSCGYDDWRVPTAEELINIVNFGYSSSNTDPLTIWHNPGAYISSTPGSFDSGRSYHVVEMGDQFNGMTFTVSRQSIFQLILVRGEN